MSQQLQDRLDREMWERSKVVDAMLSGPDVLTKLPRLRVKVRQFSVHGAELTPENFLGCGSEIGRGLD